MDKPFRIKKLKINGRWATCSVPPSSEFYDYWYERLYKDLKFKWTIFTTEQYLNHVERIDKRARKKFCHKGYHKIKNVIVTYKQGGQRTQKFTFLKCQHCNYLFFTSKNEKERYINREKEAKERLSAVFASLSGREAKPLISTGRGANSEGSASSSHTKGREKNASNRRRRRS